MSQLKNKNKIHLLLGACIFLVFFTLSFYLYLISWGKKPVFFNKAVLVELKRGESLGGLARQLEKNKFVSSNFLFYWYVRLHDKYSSFQAGRYKLEGFLSPQELSSMMKEGRVYYELSLELSIPEGSTLQMIAEKLVDLGITSEKKTLKLSHEKSLLKLLVQDVISIEGFLYPATYRFYDYKPSSLEILKRMIEEFFIRLPEGYEKKVKKLGLSLLEAVTFASLIEKETLLAEERPLVSEVIWKRLKAGMPLGIDAAIIYGIKGWDGDLKTAHLRDRKNLYNLRLHRGLPPGPICSPSKAALQAVLSPANEGYYYYVLLPGNGSRHHFSKTLKEHNFFVKKLVNYQKKIKLKSNKK